LKPKYSEKTCPGAVLSTGFEPGTPKWESGD
jgi:hypothetical protein